MRFLKLQVVLLLLTVIVVAAVAGDIVLKNRAETELAAEITRRVPETNGVQARISSFPFVGRLVLSGKVPEVDVTAQHSGAGGVDLVDIQVRAEEVELDTDAAMDGRAVVKSIERGTVQADLRQDQINRRLPKGFQVRLEPGSALVSGPGGTEAKLALSPEGSLQLRIANRTLLDLALPDTKLLPCRPTATFVTNAVRLSCAFTNVPPLLVDLARR